MTDDQPTGLETLAGAPSDVRTCATCACSIELTNPRNLSQPNIFCRRNVPQGVEQRIDGKDPITGKPKSSVQLLMTHEPVHRNAVCYDGWRPIGTLPGENYGVLQMAQLLVQLLKPDQNAAGNLAGNLEPVSHGESKDKG